MRFAEIVWIGVVNFLFHLDTVLTASYLEILALDLLAEISIPGSKSATFGREIIRQTLLQVAVDQKSIRADTDTCEIYSDGYTLEQPHTIPADKLEALINISSLDRWQ